jgi:hypothetical protein
MRERNRGSSQIDDCRVQAGCEKSRATLREEPLDQSIHASSQEGR